MASRWSEALVTVGETRDGAGTLGTRAYEHVRALAGKIGPRGAATPGERQAQDYAVETLGAVCQPVERQPVTGIPAPMAFSWLVITGLVLLLLVTADFARAPWGVLLYAALFFVLPRVVSAVRKRAAQGSPRASDNVIGHVTPTSAAQATVIVCAHLDSARASKLTGALWPRVHRVLQGAWLQVVLALVVLAALRWVDFYVGLVPVTIWNMVGAVALGYSVFFASFELIYMAMGRSQAYSPGANDNASGCGVVLALAEAFAADPPRHLALDFTLFTAEELGLIGSERYVAENRLAQDCTFVFNLDMVGTGDELRYARGSGLPPRRTSRRLNDLLQAAEPAIKGQWYWMGNSDSFSFAKKGIPSCWLATHGGASELVYHTLGDTMDHIKPAALDRAARAVWQAVRALDDQLHER
ncbi:MAG: Zn-dependent exopeptidase M28 [Chloroflexi bacterium]|nr:Zn-dependent exopeptidase M28 [Chloroflexota bacterium]MBU1752085.1 Zn-dependent exopeptidase M28 [Chloroflexota bacterium]